MIKYRISCQPCMMMIVSQCWSLFVNCALDRSDVSDKSYDVFRDTLLQADLSELAPYFVSNHSFYLCYLVYANTKCCNSSDQE